MIFLHCFVKLEQEVAQMQILAVENLVRHGAHVHLQVCAVDQLLGDTLGFPV